MGLFYLLLIGLPLCLFCMAAGLIMFATGAFLTFTVILAPIGIPYMGAGLATIAVGLRYLSLDGRQF